MLRVLSAVGKGIKTGIFLQLFQHLLLSPEFPVSPVSSLPLIPFLLTGTGLWVLNWGIIPCQSSEIIWNMDLGLFSKPNYSILSILSPGQGIFLCLELLGNADLKM